MLACSSYFHRFFISAQFTGRVFPARYSLSGQTIRNPMCNRPLLVTCFFLENFPLNVPMSFFPIKAQYHNRTLKLIKTNHFRNFRPFTRASYVNSDLRLNFTRKEARSSYFHRFFFPAQFTVRVFPARYSLSGQTTRNPMCNRPLLVTCFFLENFPLNVPMSFFPIKAQYHNRTLKWIRTKHSRNFRPFTRASYVNSDLRLNFTRIEAKSYFPHNCA